MRVRVVAVVGILLLLITGIPRTASAQEIAVVGGVVRADAGQDIFWIQEYGSTGAGRVWAVRVTDFARPGVQLGWPIRVGDVVEVRGVLTGANQLLARSIVVRSRGNGVGIPTPGVKPPRGQRIEIDGIIMSIDRYRQDFIQVRDELRTRSAVVWTVRLTPQTRIDGQGEQRRWSDDDDDDRAGIGGARRILNVGDFVQVEGRLVSDGQILAEEIRVRGQGGYVPSPTPYPQPFPYPPYGWQTVILSPQAGAEVSGRAFTVVGRTLPGAQVQIGVMAHWAVFNVQVANTTVTADQSGIFVLAVQPSMRVPGATYTITATSTYQGVTMTPVSVTVRQI
ncbi:MAG TPA: DUF5666 domain-containing protein [bacterium]